MTSGIDEVLNGGENRPKAARSLALEPPVPGTGMGSRGRCRERSRGTSAQVPPQ